MQKQRILLVEDEEHLQEVIRLNLELEGFHVSLAPDGEKALELFRQERFDLILLDVMLPIMDGLQVCDRIRFSNDTIPILFLTAKGGQYDRIAGLKAGADDYLTKPFSLEELLLRIQNLLKRSSGKESTKLSSYTLEGISIHFNNFELIYPDGKKLSLTRKESHLLRLLIEKKDQVVSREQILETVWGYDIYPSTRTIDNFILAFRKYFEKDPRNPMHFHSVRGVGYRFTD